MTRALITVHRPDWVEALIEIPGEAPLRLKASPDLVRAAVQREAPDVRALVERELAAALGEGA